MLALPVSPKTLLELEERLKRLGVLEKDLEEHFVRSSGPGGQKVNKSSSCVVLKHLSSQIEIKCQKTRSQALNRFWARRLLCEKLEGKILGEQSAELQRFEKIRRQKRKRSKRAKEKILEAKHHRAELKKTRKQPEEH